MTQQDAHKRLKGTFSKDKNEILFSQFGINYNEVEEIYKRGTILIRTSPSPAEVKAHKKRKAPEEEVKRDEPRLGEESEIRKEGEQQPPAKKEVIRVHDDLIEKPAFYEKYELLTKLE